MTKHTLRVAAAQTPEFRNDVPAAMAHLLAATDHAMQRGADLLCFPEAFLQGYLIDPEAARRAAMEVESSAFGNVLRHIPLEAPTIVLGMIERDGDAIYNTAVVVHRRLAVGRYRKRHLLPGERAFEPGSETPVFPVREARFGIAICHDTNFPSTCARIAGLGASLIVCPANNMMKRDRADRYRDVHNAVRAERCRETNLCLLSADVTGEREDRVSWGPTALLDQRGEVVAHLPLGQPGVLVADIPLAGTRCAVGEQSKP